MSRSAIPSIGLGTWDLRGEACTQAVSSAIALGYRHIDTARMYQNEHAVGRAIGGSTIARENLFLTTKLWLDELTESAVPRAVDDSLTKLQTDYVDLLLIHWPNPEVPLKETLTAMVREVDRERARAIGVSNFPATLWAEALEIAAVGVNQVEFHPFLGQRILLDFARQRELNLIAYTPIAKGRVADSSVIRAIAETHRRSPAQIALSWTLHQGVAAVPKAAHREHQEDNLRASEVTLEAREVAAISALAEGRRLVAPGWSPVWD